MFAARGVSVPQVTVENTFQAQVAQVARPDAVQSLLKRHDKDAKALSLSPLMFND